MNNNISDYKILFITILLNDRVCINKYQSKKCKQHIINENDSCNISHKQIETLKNAEICILYVL